MSGDYPAGLKIAVVRDVNGETFIRKEIHDAIKRQRDEAYRALVDIRDGGRTAEAQTAASQRAQVALDAISEMSSPSEDQAHGTVQGEGATDAEG